VLSLWRSGRLCYATLFDRVLVIIKLLPRKEIVNQVKVFGENKALKVTESEEAAGVFQGLLAAEDRIDQDKEHCWVMHLNSRYQMTMVELVSMGLVNKVSIHPREIYRRAIMEASVYIIVAHNHPSGDVTPSEGDIKGAIELRKAGKIIAIPLLDYLIISPTGYYSFDEHESQERLAKVDIVTSENHTFLLTVPPA
jgi:DNA repair protein RadC